MHDSQNSTQKTSSVYKLILKTQQILVWTKQPYSFFEHTHPKIIKVTFLGLHHYAKKKFTLYILEIKSILGSCDQTCHTHFWPCPFKKIDSCEFASTCKKSCYFIDLFWKHGWLKSPAIWLAENILTILKSFSQILYLCRNTANNTHFHYRTNSIKINDQIFQ